METFGSADPREPNAGLLPAAQGRAPLADRLVEPLREVVEVDVQARVGQRVRKLLVVVAAPEDDVLLDLERETFPRERSGEAAPAPVFVPIYVGPTWRGASCAAAPSRQSTSCAPCPPRPPRRPGPFISKFEQAL